MGEKCEYHAALTQQMANDKERLEMQTRQINELSTSNARLITLCESFELRLINIERGVETLKGVPGKKWDQISMYVLTAIVGFVLCWLFTQIGIG